MILAELNAQIRDLHGPASDVEGEYGISPNGCENVRSFGYATNLTPETVNGAIHAKVDLLITHHDAWGFVYGMREACVTALSEHGIAHVFAHLPLDAAPFGTAAALIKALGAKTGGGLAVENGYPNGLIGIYERPVSRDSVADVLTEVCGEAIKIWPAGAVSISSFAVVTGGGSLTKYAHEARNAKCELYITGEQSLYLIQYCLIAGLNLMIGSHTFTELPGVRALAAELQKRCPGLISIEIPETHYETAPKSVQWRPLRGATNLYRRWPLGARDV